MLEDVIDHGEGTLAGTQEVEKLRKTVEAFKRRLAREERYRDKSDRRRYRERSRKISPRRSKSGRWY